MRRHHVLWMAALLLAPGLVPGASLPSVPTTGIRVDAPAQLLPGLLDEPRLEEGARLYVAWTVDLDGAPGSAPFEELRAAGVTPWVRAVFRTPAPITDHLEQLERELESLTELVRSAGADLHVQAVWEPAAGTPEVEEHAYLLKRAGVAVTGTGTGALFAAGPLPADPERLEALYQHEVAAYLDWIVLAPGGDVAAAATALGELDPGKPIAVDALPWPEPSTAALGSATELAAAGVALTFFEAPSDRPLELAPLKVLALELRGDLSLDETGAPTGVDRAWTYVRAEDLALRVIVETPVGADPVRLRFGDSQLRRPRRIDLTTGDSEVLFDQRRTEDGLTIAVEAPGPVMLLRLERPSFQELEGFGGQIEVAEEWQMPVEEILSRLQAFEDDQARKLDHYQSRSSLNLRFQTVRGAIDVTYAGDFFFKRGEDFDWVWEDFYFEGVKWRSGRLPELPLIQPEKAAALPVEIRLGKEYSYRLRGTDEVDGRDCWVIDFRPVEVAPGRSLFQGTVWVDRAIYARVRTRATQVGLEGDVLSNEETTFFAPVDVDGRPAPWSRDSYILPTRISGQQTLSVLSAILPVEKETVVTNLRINGEGFAENRRAALASELTMVRDTDQGLRYLRKTEDGDRVVEAELDTSRFFLLGGVFWDESLDYPLPLLGVNYLDLDFLDTGSQLNVLFAGAYLNTNLSNPSIFGSRWNAGARLSGSFFKFTDELYRDGEVVSDEDVKSRSAGAALFAGRPLGNFFKLDLTYGLRHTSFSRADDTAADFVLPQDTLTTTLEAELSYSRGGYRLRLAGSDNSRSDWEEWGLPGNPQYDPNQSSYRRWEATVSKTWWLSKFRKLGVYLEHLDGSRLDRFSRYDFGIFGDSNVAGYQSGLVRADSVDGLHVNYGINAFEVVRFELGADAVWATSESTGLDRELLAGVGLEGTVTLPWQMAMSFEIGVAVAGPGEGSVAARIFFLKLFPEN